MKTVSYNRSQIYSGADLSDVEIQEVMSNYNFELSDVYDNSFVKFINRTLSVEILPLDMFMRIDSPIWNGVYGTSAFSGYYIKISNSGDMCLIASKYS